MKRNPWLTAIGALLILLFTGGPVLLAFIGSVVPDRVMFAADRGLFDEVTLENYRYIFTGEVPPAYLKSGANRTMISDAARQAPGSLWNSAQIALAALVLNLAIGAPAAFIYARYAFPGKRLTFLFLILSLPFRLVESVINRRSDDGACEPDQRWVIADGALRTLGWRGDVADLRRGSADRLDQPPVNVTA